MWTLSAVLSVRPWLCSTLAPPSQADDRASALALQVHYLLIQEDQDVHREDCSKELRAGWTAQGAGRVLFVVLSEVVSTPNIQFLHPPSARTEHAALSPP